LVYVGAFPIRAFLLSRRFGNMFPYFIPYIFSLGLSIGVAIVTWRRRSVPGAQAYSVYSMGVAIWILGYIFELASHAVAGKGFWDDFQWIGTVIISITFPLFAIRFSQIDSKNINYHRILFSIVPGIFFTLLLTNHLHGLIRGESWLIEAEPFAVLMYDFSPVVWFFVLYTYVVAILGIVIIVRRYFDTLPIYRTQIGLISVGALFPLVGTIMSLTGVSLSEQRDITPITFAIGNVFVAWGLLRYGIFNLVPIARNTVIDMMGDLVVVLDPSGRIVDINPAAVELSEFSRKSAIGCQIQEVFPVLRPLVDEVEKLEEGSFEIREGNFFFDVMVKSLYDDHQGLRARVFVAHNVTTHKKLEDQLRRLNNLLEERVQQRTQQLADAYDTTLEGWAKALELRDQETEGHSRRVTEMTVCVAREMGINGLKLDHIRRGALLHDIGKMGVPDRILHKPDDLTDDEFNIVRKHPIIAKDLLKSISFLEPALNIPYYHHEWWNGNGYPEGLKGEEIPLEARIFAVIDHWDALSSNRPYRPAWPQEKVIAYLQENAGKIFDPEVVVNFLELLDSGISCF